MCVWYMRRNNMPVLRTCDVFAPGLALGHAFGRVGCFAAGCCWGKPTHVPWAVTFHNPLANEIVGTPLGVPLHPTQLYEMVVELANCLFLVWLLRRKKFEGEIIGTYMIIYGVARYFIEFFRGDPGRGNNFLGFMAGRRSSPLAWLSSAGCCGCAERRWFRQCRPKPQGSYQFTTETQRHRENSSRRRLRHNVLLTWLSQSTVDGGPVCDLSPLNSLLCVSVSLCLCGADTHVVFSSRMAERFPITISVPPDAAGQRLDQFLTANIPDISRARVQQLLAEEKALVNGASAKPSLRLRGGEQITILGDPEPPPLRAIAEDIPLDIIYEDDDLAVINKPAGMMVHAGAGATESERNRGTLVNALLHRFAKLSEAGGELRPGIVHRLDKETSGLIIVAKNDVTHRKLGQQFSGRQVKKRYVALVHGWPAKDRGTINAEISRDVVRRIRMTTRGSRRPRSHHAL